MHVDSDSRAGTPEAATAAMAHPPVEASTSGVSPEALSAPATAGEQTGLLAPAELPAREEAFAWEDAAAGAQSPEAGAPYTWVQPASDLWGGKW